MSPPQITRPAPEYPKTRFHPLIVLKSHLLWRVALIVAVIASIAVAFYEEYK